MECEKFTQSGQKEYLTKKRLEVLEKIRPICEKFGIKDYEYKITDTGSERLIVNNIELGCTSYSANEIADELFAYIFVTEKIFRNVVK